MCKIMGIIMLLQDIDSNFNAANTAARDRKVRPLSA